MSGIAYVGISGIVTAMNVCEVMKIIANRSTQSSIGGFEKNILCPNGSIVHGFVFWATAALTPEETIRMREITGHLEY